MTFTSSVVGGKLVEIGPLGGKVGSVYEEFEDNVGSSLYWVNRSSSKRMQQSKKT